MLRNSLRSMVLILCLSPAVSALAQQPCASLTALNLPHTKVIAADSVPGSTMDVPATVLPAFSLKLPASCRVKLESSPTPDSKIAIEIWLPSDWNGVFVQVGNGGLGGSLPYPQMLSPLSRGYVVAATDDGHTGSAIDGSWAAGHPEKITDFAYRAVHETREAAGFLIAAFYGRKPAHTYFNGCSEGGREALMEAQRYPDDFDGILAGAAAMSWTPLMASFAWNAQSTLKDPESYIPVAKRPAIEKAALAACGRQDGVEDAFIKDPLSCRFNPSVLQCSDKDTDACLTKKQVTALEKIYGGARNSRTDMQLEPGYEPGAEGEPGAPGITYDSYVFGPAPGTSLALFFSSAFYGSFVFNDPKYSSLALDFDGDIAKTESKVGGLMNVVADLNAFKKRGGKLLQYHGWNDGSPSPLLSVEYYDKVAARAGGAKATSEFYRLFMVPGMMHCGSGPGPNLFGNLLDTRTATTAEDDIFLALRAWVESGRQPDSIIATKFAGDDPAKPVTMTRPLCSYPQVAKWDGKGSTAAATSFRCELPAHR